MAYTKIHAIKATVNKAIKYITNPAKTDGKMLVDSFGCTPETADAEFEYELKKTLSAGPNKAFHLIQSFMPGEVSYDEAHTIGTELADKLLDGKYSYVIATHIDHDHVHNHIIFCASDNIEHKKYDDNKRSYYHIRELSDQLCKEHNLSIIEPGVKRGKQYKEWLSEKNGTSWKAKLKNDIDEAIKISKSYENFIEIMKAKGYEIKGEDFGEGAAKYIAFRPLESKQFIRGADRSFGPGYTKEKIKDRIDENLKLHENKIPFPKRTAPAFEQKTAQDITSKKPKDLLKDPCSTLIDTSTDKMQSSPGLLRWANIQNLKAAAHAYAVAGDIEALEAKIAEKESVVKASKDSLVSLEKKMKPAAEIMHYAEIYMSNLRYHNAMARSKDPDRYYRDHDIEINLFNAAEHVLRDKYHINPSAMNYKHMQESFALMQDKKETLTSTWKTAEKELRELQSQLKNLNEYLSSGGAESVQSHVHEESHEEEQIQPSDKSQPLKKGQSL